MQRTQFYPSRPRSQVNVERDHCGLDRYAQAKNGVRETSSCSRKGTGPLRASFMLRLFLTRSVPEHRPVAKERSSCTFSERNGKMAAPPLGCAALKIFPNGKNALFRTMVLLVGKTFRKPAASFRPSDPFRPERPKKEPSPTQSAQTNRSSVETPTELSCLDRSSLPRKRDGLPERL